MKKRILCGILAALMIICASGCTADWFKKPDNDIPPSPEEQDGKFQIPEYTDPNILSQLLGKDERVTQRYDFEKENYPLTHFQGDPALRFTTNGKISKGAYGIHASSENWNATGFTKKITQRYTASARLYNFSDSTSPTSSVMFGVRLKSLAHLFIDSGLWVSVNNGNAELIIHNVFTVNIGRNLNFDAKDGVEVRFEDDGTFINIFVNDQHLALVLIDSANNTVSVFGEGCTPIRTASADKLAHGDSLGYVRAMQHFADSAIGSIEICEGTIKAYSPKEDVTLIKDGFDYFLSEKTQYKCSSPIVFCDGVVLMDARTVADLFDFHYAENGNTFAFARGEVAIMFEEGKHYAAVNSCEIPFPTVIRQGNTFLVCVDYFARWMGYTVKIQDGNAFIVADEAQLTEEKISELEARYKLYADVVYNYDDVDVDQRGVGLYGKTPYEDRLVGIAYSTWHSGSLDTWGNRSWDTPLGGAYFSTNRKVIYEHGILLRDAGIDFVFVDWTNNTNYDRSSTNQSLATFRMIEYATDLLFEIWSQIEGAPKICIFTGPGHQGIESVNNGNHQKKTDQIYRDYVEKYPDMYFNYEGKPLLICYGATPNQYSPNPSWNDDRFTIRWATGYVGQQSSLYDKTTLKSHGFWSWEERGAQTYTVGKDGKVEAITCTASSRQQGTPGGSGYIPAYGREDGMTLKKQFQRANDLGAGIVLLVSWNEWNNGEQPSPEISKDLEPSQIHGTFYYDLLCEQIKKFKGQTNEG